MSGFAHTSFEHNIVLAKYNSRQYNIKNEIKYISSKYI